MMLEDIAALAAADSRKCHKSWSYSLIVTVGLAVFSNPVLAQQQREIQIWRTTTLGFHKGVNSYRDALDAAKIKIGDAADEILGRPTFHYVKEKTEVELTLLSAAELGIESE